MVKRLLSVASALLLMLLPALGLAQEERVFDEANLFTESEIAQMNTIIEELRSTYQIDAVILTTYDVQKTSSDRVIQDYADLYYENGGFGVGSDNAGILYMIDMTNHAPVISTSGVMIDYITDSRLEDLFDATSGMLKSGAYGRAAIEILNLTRSYMKKGIDEGHFRYDAETGERLSGLYNKLTGTEAFLSLAIGALVACLFGAGVAKRYSLKGAAPSNQAIENGTAKIVDESESFLRENVARIPKAQMNRGGGPGGRGGGRPGGGGGSSVHFSSSGGSHGGGVGGRF